MITVTEKVKAIKDNGVTEGRIETNYPKAEFAWVNNGVLTLYAEGADAPLDFTKAIAGYEAGTWLSWRKKA